MSLLKVSFEFTMNRANKTIQQNPTNNPTHSCSSVRASPDWSIYGRAAADRLSSLGMFRTAPEKPDDGVKQEHGAYPQRELLALMRDRT
jgi:hypothetical protein